MSRRTVFYFASVFNATRRMEQRGNRRSFGPFLRRDLADLPIFDIYSVFAGWHVQHEEIFEVPVERWTAANKRQAEPLQRALDDQGFHSSRPLWLGHFLGEVCLVAEVSRDNTLGVAVTDGLETISYYRRGRSRPIGPVEAYSIYKGRKMLRSFNPDNTFELADDSDLDS